MKTMQKAIFFTFSVVLVLTMISCGATSPTTRATAGSSYSSQSYAERWTPLGDSPDSEISDTVSVQEVKAQTAVDYPETETIAKSYSGKDKDGYEISSEITFWQPVKATESMYHPSNTSYVMSRVGGDYAERKQTYIPFTITVENQTAGFGATVCNLGVAIYDCGADGYENSFVSFVSQSDNPSDWGYQDGGQESDICFAMLDVRFSSDETASYLHGSRLKFAIDDGIVYTICGYATFVEMERTPNNPTGATAEYLDEHRQYVFMSFPTMDTYKIPYYFLLVEDGDNNLAIVESPDEEE